VTTALTRRRGAPERGRAPLVRVSPRPGELDEEERELVLTWEESRRRSESRREARRRRLRTRRLIGGAALGALVILAGLGGFLLLSRGGEVRHGPAAAAAASAGPAGERARAAVPSAAAIRTASRYARERGGLVSFAIVDSGGRVRGVALDRRYLSASVVKVMLLAAELERLRRDGLPLDPITRDLLTRMITYSDNAAADQIYDRVGDAGVQQVAVRAGMGDFTVSGYWANAQITARDVAGLMWRLGDVLRGTNRRFARLLLERIVPAQRWGIPAAAGRGWEVRFKGGWRTTERGELAHQAAELQREGGPRVAIAVLTDAQPSQDHAVGTVRGVAERLLGSGRAGRSP
jgi:Beta-lactamase enzyme family